jgi:hypothetical protein
MRLSITAVKQKSPDLIGGFFYVILFLSSVLTKGPRSIYKIVAKIKEAMVAFVHH